MKFPSWLASNPWLKKADTPGLIRVLLIAALVLLPFSHLRWLPNLGTTRPISSVLFVLVLGLIILSESIPLLRKNGFKLKLIQAQLLGFPGAHILYPWLILILLGIISAAITPFYGNFLQALNRLLGYGIIFATLYCGLYARKIFGMQLVAKWISLGYIVVLLYGIIETAAINKLDWALKIVQFVRAEIVVPFGWGNRITYFATEASFVGFHLILLIALLPFVQSKILKTTNILIILIALVYSQSGNIVMQVTAYLVFWLFFQLSFTLRVWLFASSTVLVILAVAWYAFFTPIKYSLADIQLKLIEQEHFRLASMINSYVIRIAHLLNLVYALAETRGLGLGIGQYGHFWKEIFLRHFDPLVVDPTGEIAAAIDGPAYGRPWSVILGIGVDLGVLGLLILFNFFYRVWRLFQSPHSRGIFIASMIAMIGAYPIITPHVWLALALLTAPVELTKKEAAAA